MEEKKQNVKLENATISSIQTLTKGLYHKFIITKKQKKKEGLYHILGDHYSLSYSLRLKKEKRKKNHIHLINKPP